MNVPSITHTRDGCSDGGPVECQRGQTLAALAWAGIVGPVVFTVGFLAQEAVRRDEYDPISEVVSALEVGPSGWVQQANFIVLGLLTIAFAVGLHRGVRPTKTGIVGPAVLAITGIGCFVSAVFPLSKDAAGLTVFPVGHQVGGLMFFGGSAIGLIVLSRRMARDPRWRRLATYTLVAGILVVISFFVMGRFVLPDDAPLHEWAGLAQRLVVILILFPCRIALSIRLLHIAREQR